MKKVIYLAHYDLPSRTNQRYRSAPACAKIDYISQTIAELGFDIELISASNTQADRCPHEEVIVAPNFKITFLKAMRRSGNKLCRILPKLHFNLNLLLQSLKRIKHGDTLIVYHSLALMWLVKIIKRIKKIKLVLEVEEIYADVINDARIRKKELEYFKIADSYLFCSDVLKDYINTDNKPYAVIYGTYKVEPERNVKRNDGKIHLLYAGTFSAKKGVMTAISLASLLPNNYHIHILGQSNQTVMEKIRNRIDFENSAGNAIVTYDGFLSDEEYIRFVQSCDIGLSPQNSNTTFNETSFPSKVLSYLSNGLRVVSVKLNPLEKSSVNYMLHYYSDDNKKNFADVIQSIDISKPYDSRAVVSELDEKFKMEIISLL